MSKDLKSWEQGSELSLKCGDLPNLCSISIFWEYLVIPQPCLPFFPFFLPVFGILWGFEICSLAVSPWFGVLLFVFFLFGLPQGRFFGEFYAIENASGRTASRKLCSVQTGSHLFSEAWLVCSVCEILGEECRVC